jgi:hypothetical protein
MNRTVLAVSASVVVILAVLVAVLVFGVIPLPDYPSLADHPDTSIQGTVAFITDENPPCLGVVPAGGGPTTELRCGVVEVGTLGWTSEGLIITIDFSSMTSRYLLIDPASGEVVDAIAADVDEPKPLAWESQSTRADGAVLITDGGRGTTAVKVHVPNEEPTTILSADGPQDYSFDVATWSPDGRWVLVVDSEGRILVVGESGTPAARLLAEGASRWMNAAWYIPGYPGVDIGG